MRGTIGLVVFGIALMTPVIADAQVSPGVVPRDRIEDRLDRREDVRDRRENRRDLREDRRDARHDGGLRDRLEDVRDRREDVDAIADVNARGAGAGSPPRLPDLCADMFGPST
jgi:hypothetical protein